MRPSTRRSSRKGYTLLELVVVVALVIILGAVVVPNLARSYSNTRQKNAADLIRERLVQGRAKAMEQGVWYRVAISQDKKRVRLAPDTQSFSSSNSSSPSGTSSPESRPVEDKLDEKVTAEVSFDNSDDPRSSDNSDDWITVMTVGPEGICREQYNTTVKVKEGKFQDIYIQVRPIVGGAAIVPPPKNGGK